LEFTHAILACHIIFKMTISDYTVPEELMRYPLSLSAVGLLSGVIIFSAQGFFATCVHKCFGSPYISSLCWTLAFLRFVGVIGLGAHSMKRPTFQQKPHIFNKFLTTVLAISAGVDAIIAFSLCYHLFRERRNSITRRTIRIVDRVIVVTIATGLAFCISAVAMLIFSLTIPRISALTALMLFEAELLSISMLANLNGRSVHREISAQVPDQRCTRPQLNFITKPTYVAEIALNVDSSSLRDERYSTKPIDV